MRLTANQAANRLPIPPPPRVSNRTGRAYVAVGYLPGLVLIAPAGVPRGKRTVISYREWLLSYKPMPTEAPQ